MYSVFLSLFFAGKNAKISAYNMAQNIQVDKALIDKAAAYVKAKMLGEHTGHDWYHIQRVCQMARNIAEKEGGDPALIELAALLHDLGDYKQHEFNEIKGSFILRGMMDVLEIEDDLKEKLVKIIDESQFLGDETARPKTLEGKILQDADWLDSLGAIGVARTFATGGSLKRVIHDPHKKPRGRLSRADYQFRKQDGTSMNHFYEKVLKLPVMLNTETAKIIAKHRIEFINQFIEEFFAEWNGKK